MRRRGPAAAAATAAPRTGPGCRRRGQSAVPAPARLPPAGHASAWLTITFDVLVPCRGPLPVLSLSATHTPAVPPSPTYAASPTLATSRTPPPAARPAPPDRRYLSLRAGVSASGDSSRRLGRQGAPALAQR